MRRPQLCWLFPTNPSLYKTRGGSLNSLWWHWAHAYLPDWFGIGATALALAALLWRRQKSLAATLEFGAIFLLLVIWVAKYSVSGYYLIVVVGLLLAASLYPVANHENAEPGSQAALGGGRTLGPSPAITPGRPTPGGKYPR
jgi:hypothetical protein